MNNPQFHTMPDGRRIAMRFLPGVGPALVFLPGYMSDMEGAKAAAVMDWARRHGRACLLFDYSGCGQSGGAFADGSLSRWRDEALAVIDAAGVDRCILIGSSMGGWLMLLAGLQLGDRLAGLIGIAPAPDFTEWGRSGSDKKRLQAGETLWDDNPYGPDPTPIHADFWRDGQDRLLLDRDIALTCRVRLLHGQCDADVPWDISMRLAAALRSDAVQVTLVKDGDHRLSRPQDIHLLLDLVRSFDTPPS